MIAQRAPHAPPQPTLYGTVVPPLPGLVPVLRHGRQHNYPYQALELHDGRGVKWIVRPTVGPGGLVREVLLFHRNRRRAGGFHTQRTLVWGASWDGRGDTVGALLKNIQDHEVFERQHAGRYEKPLRAAEAALLMGGMSLRRGYGRDAWSWTNRRSGCAGATCADC